ncbi:amino acid ABC transporter permease [Scatolibacter rhodanostii]|uniref:amino acid ABC transporter permease n=1 Tax=Scatolibacter rhodanostii TaxID=2014781 RepID=UPI000C06AFD1|nr:amino acid ABC transporter permease [Scatolibacter rhodanostii]
MLNLGYFLDSLKAAVSYIPQNLFMSLMTLLICCVLGTLAAMARVYQVPVIKPICDFLLALLKALPQNLVLLIVYLVFTITFSPIMAFLGVKANIQNVDMVYVAIAALSISSLAGVSEVIRAGLLSVGKGQYEAGYTVGLTAGQTFFHIILPQTIRAVIPPLTNSILSLVKATSLVSVIGVMDIMNGAIVAANTYYSYIEAYVAAALVFWVLGIIIEIASRKVEIHFSRSVKQLA